MNIKIHSTCLKIIFHILLISGLSMTSYAQQVLETSLDKDTILIGDQAILRVEARLEYAEQVLDLGPLPGPKGLEWVGAGSRDTIRQNGKVWYRFEFPITGFDSGDYQVPAIPVTVFTDSGNITRWTDSLLLIVQTVPVDTTKAFAPIKDILPVKFSIWDYLPWIIAGIGLLLLLLALYLYLKKRKRKGLSDKPLPEQAHEWAERELKELENRKLWQQGQLKAYYESLSHILKMYLDSRYGMQVMEQTTDDLIRNCKKDKRLRTVRKEIRMILQTADLVKFAKANPEEESHLQCMQAARDIVKRTRFVPEEKEGRYE